ncbi:hypothetical protein DFJ74DRAFT_677805 [Hyaloraphidium curvatum]|nr:hypothetical protein DFJ74DRAFT_677805 [Hyaloraphidium curvatum]
MAASLLRAAFAALALWALLVPALAVPVRGPARPTAQERHAKVKAALSRPVNTADVPDVDEVLIVWGFHLDIGFTADRNHFSHSANAVSVLNAYLNEFLSQAIDMNGAIRQVTGGNDSYVLTTHAYLIRLLWECGQEGGGKEDDGIGLKYGGRIRCPDETMQRKIWDALLTSRLTYHAFPFNPELESGSESLTRAGLDLVAWLDHLLASSPAAGAPPLRKKTVVSQRDVPGISSGTVPVWNERGVRGMTLGCNAASATVGVPHNRPFLWKGKPRQGEAEAQPVIVMYNDGGYGWEDDPVYHLHHLSPPGSGSKCRTGVVFQWWYDNSGPHPLQYIQDTYALIRKTYPNANVRTADLEEVWDAFEKPECKERMELFEGEMGDTWVYGWGSDPSRNWGFRELNRLREACLADEKCDKDIEGPFGNFTFWLLKGIEHTWGGSVVEFLGVEDYLETWRPREFNHHRFVHENFRDLASTWTEQREMILEWAAAALEAGSHSLAAEARRIVDDIWGRGTPVPVPPPLVVQGEARGALRKLAPGEVARGWVGPHMWEVAFDRGEWEGGELRRGSRGLEHLVFAIKAEEGGYDVAAMAVKGGKSGLGGVEYRLYDDSEFRDFVYEYCYLYISEFDLYKTGLPKSLHKTALLPRVDSIDWDGRTPRFTVHLSFQLPGKQGRRDWEEDPTHSSLNDPLYGVPLNLTVLYEIDPARQRLEVTVDWDGKRATRIPEGISTVFRPTLGGRTRVRSLDEVQGAVAELLAAPEPAAEDWLVEKIGTLVSPADVFLNGSQFIHHTWHGLGQPGGIWVHTPDSGLVSVGTTRMLPYPLAPGTTRMDRGAAVNLYNNLWGTNFLQWWPVEKEETGAARFRFRVEFWDGKSIPPVWNGHKDE